MDKAIHRTNRTFWCRICGQAISPFNEQAESKKLRADLVEGKTDCWYSLVDIEL